MDDGVYYYTYDNNGNMTSKVNHDPNQEAFVFTYNSKNQLIQTVVTSGTFSGAKRQMNYAYDAIGRRMQKSVVDNESSGDVTKNYTRQYVYDGQNIYAEFDASGSLLVRFVNHPLTPDDVLAAVTTQAAVTSGMANGALNWFFHKDHLGSIMSVRDYGGDLALGYNYTAFGTPMAVDANGNAVSSPALNFGLNFTGREWEPESGLYYYRARYYDPGTGRFLQADPRPGSIGSPMSIVNRYAYASNNPILMVDPTGTSSIFGWIVAALLPIQSLVAMNTSDFFQTNFGFTGGDIKAYNAANVAAAIIGLTIATGGSGAGFWTTAAHAGFLAVDVSAGTSTVLSWYDNGRTPAALLSGGESSFSDGKSLSQAFVLGFAGGMVAQGLSAWQPGNAQTFKTLGAMGTWLSIMSNVVPQYDPKTGKDIPQHSTSNDENFGIGAVTAFGLFGL